MPRKLIPEIVALTLATVFMVLSLTIWKGIGKSNPKDEWKEMLEEDYSGLLTEKTDHHGIKMYVKTDSDEITVYRPSYILWAHIVVGDSIRKLKNQNLVYIKHLAHSYAYPYMDSSSVFH